jgi:hypothetical protein
VWARRFVRDLYPCYRVFKAWKIDWLKYYPHHEVLYPSDIELKDMYCRHVFVPLFLEETAEGYYYASKRLEGYFQDFKKDGMKLNIYYLFRTAKLNRTTTISISKLCRALRIPRLTLYRAMKRHGIDISGGPHTYETWDKLLSKSIHPRKGSTSLGKVQS